jgi:tRNA A37 threonylcarbamoyladenosine dehydratase
MKTAVMKERIAEVSPRFKAKIAVKRVSKQQVFNSMFRRTHGTSYWY